MKILNLIAFLVGIIIITFIIWEGHYTYKYNATQLNVTIKDLKNEWGQPDYEFVPKNEKDCRVVKYNKSLFGQYVFLSDMNDELIVTKAFDD